MSTKASLNENIQESFVVEPIDYKNPYDFSILHRHSYFEILLFKHGEGGKQIIDFEEFSITPKSIFIVSPGQVHLVKRKPAEKGMLIQFTKEFMSQCSAPLYVNLVQKFREFPKIELDNIQFRKLDLIFKELMDIYEKKSPMKPQKLIHLTGFLLFELFELLPQKTSVNKSSRLAREFMSLVEEQFSSVRNLKDYSELLHVPASKLSTDVKKYFGKSPLQLIHEELLIEIKRLLIVEKLSHKEIVFKLNFDSHSSYTRFVKTHTALTPTQLKSEISKIAK